MTSPAGARAWLAWCAILAALFALVNGPLVRGTAVPIWDANAYFFPHYTVIADFARAGRLALWDPWSSAGAPIAAEPSLGVFSPVMLLVGVVLGGSWAGYVVYLLVSWWLGGVGLLMLARHLGAPAWGAAAVGLGYLFNGLYVGHVSHLSIVTAYSFLSLVIWRLDVALVSRRTWPAVEAGALWGLSALSGYPGVAIASGLFAVLWATGRVLLRDRDVAAVAPGDAAPAFPATPPWSGVRAVALLGVVGLVVLAPGYVIYFAEATGYHARVDPLSREAALSVNALYPAALATLATPFFALQKWNNVPSLWPLLDPPFCSVYAGALGPVLAAFALVSRPRHAWRWWLAAMAALALACALGFHLPVRGWLYDWVYPTRFFRNTTLFRGHFLFFVAVLALLGTRDLSAAMARRIDGAWVRLLAAAGGVAAVAVVIAVHGGPAVAQESPVGPLLRYGAVGAWGACVLVALIAWRLPHDARRWFVPLAFIGLAAGDALLTRAVSPTLWTSIPSEVDRWRRVDALHVADIDLSRGGLRRVRRVAEPPVPALNNDQFFFKVPVLESYATASNRFYDGFLRDDLLAESALGERRIWFSASAVEVAPTARAFAAFAARARLLGAPPLVVHARDEILRRRSPGDGSAPDPAAIIGAQPAAERIAVDRIAYDPDALAFDVVAPAGGWLLVTDRWARGWRAEVNGEATPVHAGNFVFRAVRVRAGPNHVRFTYHPFGVPWLVVASWATVAGVGAWSVAARLTRLYRSTKSESR